MRNLPQVGLLQLLFSGSMKAKRTLLMLSEDSDLYDKKEIKVEKRPTEHNQPDANTVPSSLNSSEVENSDIVKKSTVSSSSNSKNHH
jgi:hypothetical protein